MDEQIISPSLLIISGILVSAIVIIFLSRVSNKILRFFQLYPESKTVLKMALKFISWFVGIVVFLLFLRLALRQWNLEFTMKFVEGIINASPKYVLAIIIVLTGFYVSRIIREHADSYSFEYKDRLMLFLDFVIHMTFVLTALYSIGINVMVLFEIYKVIIWVFGLIIALVISMIIGIPIGISMYNKISENQKPPKHDKKN